MSDSRLLIHIGYEKAGSTWLQHNVFNEKRGFMTPNPSFRGPSALAVDQFVIRNAFRFSVESVRKVFEPVLQEATKQGLIAAISQESLAGNHVQGRYWGKEVADKIHAVFPAAQILIIIREQKSMIKSSYGKYLKLGGAVTIQRYIGSGGTLIPGFGAICQLDYLEYDLLIEYYQNLFGRENLLVLPFELLKKDQQAFAKRIISFAGSNGELINLQTSAKNVGVHGATFAVRRNLNLFCARMNHGGSRFPLTWRIANKLSSVIDRVLPQNIHKRVGEQLDCLIADGVADCFRESNQRTSHLIGFNLADLGYDC